jgi:hypothetical protein
MTAVEDKIELIAGGQAVAIVPNRLSPPNRQLQVRAAVLCSDQVG